MWAPVRSTWIGTSSGAATAIGRARGLPVKSLSVLYRNTPSVIFSRADAPIRTPTDLYGKRIGLVPGSVTVDEYRGLLAVRHMERAALRKSPSTGRPSRSTTAGSTP